MAGKRLDRQCPADANMTRTSPRAISSQEWGRKAVHLSGVLIPIVLLHIPRKSALLLVGGAVIPAVAIEACRLQVPVVGAWFHRRFGSYMRPHERNRPSSTIHLLLGTALAVFCFGPEIAALAVAFLVIGDPAAALVGIRFGTHRVGAKSLEGSLAFLAACMLPVLFLTPVPLSARMGGAVAATMAELFSGPLDDNFTIPLVSGLVVVLLIR